MHNHIVPIHSPQVSPFDQIKRTRADGSEYWSARDLMPLLGYDSWRRFVDAIDRAKAAAENQGTAVDQAFCRSRQEATGGRPGEDVHLSRFAAYLVAMNGDPRKDEVAAAQSYFAIRTREAEVRERPAELTGPELVARALIEANNMLAAKEEELQIVRPKAEAFDDFLSSKGDYSVNGAAKVLARRHRITIGEKRLRDLLFEWGWLYRREGRPAAIQAQIERGRLGERAQWRQDYRTGERIAAPTQVRITPKGIDDIARRIDALPTRTA